jgi:hypothetical protein
MAPEANGVEGWEQWFGTSDSGENLAWDMETSPRLSETDLADPQNFHRRLAEWIMNQK